MPTIKPSGKIFGATVEGLDLSKPLGEKNRAPIFRGLGMYGVLHFPKQSLDAPSLKAFSQHFGTLEIHVSNMFQEPGVPEVMILSNIVENGKPIGMRREAKAPPVRPPAQHRTSAAARREPFPQII